MLHRLTFAPFPNAATETWFAALGDALEADGATGLLLANLTVSEAQTLSAVAVLPGRVVILRPAAEAPGRTTNLEQQTALATWLSTWPELPPVPAAAIVGIAISSDSSTVPDHAAGWPTTTLEALPQLLRELPTMLSLPATALENWATSLTDNEDTADQTNPGGFWEQQARQLWNWLGATDVPADPPYGAAPAALDTAAEQQRLLQLREQVFGELEQQRLQMEVREAAREQSIAQLQQQLAAAPSADAEVAALHARLAAESREKNELAAAITASRQEAEIRNRELETRMQQLGQQVEQLQSRPATSPAATVAAAPTIPAAPATLPLAPAAGGMGSKSAPVRRPIQAQWDLQWSRVALVLGLLGAIGVGGWAAQHFANPPSRPVENRRPAREVRTDDENLEAAAPTLFDIQPDTIPVDPEKNDSEEEIIPESTTPAPAEVMDSVVAPAEGI